MKTTVKQIAAVTFIALILLVGNAKADGTETIASSHENIETTLQLENWMTDETIWNTNSLEFVQETEATLELENWMINDDKWNTENTYIETELTVEPWMIDNNIWE